MRIGLLASVGRTLDAFFPEIIERWRAFGNLVFPAAGTSADTMISETVPAVTRRPALRNLQAPRQLAQWSVRNKLDVIVTNTATASALMRLASQPAPVIYFCHGLHWSVRPALSERPWVAIERALLRRTDGVIVMNGADEDWFQRHAPRTPFLRLPYGVGVDLRRFSRSALREVRSPFRIVWIGEFSERKRPIDVVRIAESLRRRGIRFQVVMLGEGVLKRRTEQEIVDAGLADSVEVVGQADAARFLSWADVLLHTAEWEGLARVILEASAVGRPIVGYDVKGVHDLDHVRVFPVGDTERVVEGLLEVMLADSAHDSPPEPVLLSHDPVADETARFLENVVQLRRSGS